MPITPAHDRDVTHMIAKYRFVIIVAVIALAAAIAGLYFTGVLGGGSGQPEARRSMEPIAFTEPFIVNLADTDAVHYIKLSVAVQLKPMTESDRAAFLGLGAKEGASKVTGETKVAMYPPLRDAVIDVVSRYTADELLKPEGKADLKKQLLERFAAVAAVDSHNAGLDAPKRSASSSKGKKHKDTKSQPKPAHDPMEPPYEISDVFFAEFAVQ